MSLYVPKFKAADETSIFYRAAGKPAMVAETTTLPGLDQAGPFRVQAKQYGNDHLARVIALCRPTA
jgi:hypothetical protein